jgi:hypothetical protein
MPEFLFGYQRFCAGNACFVGNGATRIRQSIPGTVAQSIGFGGQSGGIPVNGRYQNVSQLSSPPADAFTEVAGFGN